ncbi:MAG: MFS transporter [Deltaproteobacteria bacterium]|nr:MFS transporter [Deltaproteobacteria bacterium]
MAEQQQNPLELPKNAVRLGWVSLWTDLGAEMMAPLLPMLLAGMGSSGATWIGVIEGGADGLASLLKRYSGRLSDRLPRRKPLVVAGYGLASLVRPLMTLVTAPWHVLAIRLTDRVGKGIRTAPRDALLADCAHKGQEGRVFGFQRSMDHAGAVGGPLVAAGLLHLGWSLPAIFALTIIPSAFAVIEAMRIEEPEAKQRTAQAATSQPLPGRLRSFVWIIGLFALGNSPDALLLLRAKELGAPAAALPLLWSGLHVVKVLSSRWGGAWADRVPKTRMVLSGWMVYALCYLAFAQVADLHLLVGIFAFYGLYHGLCEPAEKALVKELVPAELRGQAYGAYHFATGIAALPAGLLAGWLWQHYGAPAALGFGAAVAAAASALLVVWQRADRPQSAQL